MRGSRRSESQWLDEGVDVEESWKTKQTKMGEWKRDGIARGATSLLNWANTGENIYYWV